MVSRKSKDYHKATILQVVPSLIAGGVERGTIEIAKAIAAAAFDPLVVSGGGPLVSKILDAGGKHIQMNIDTKNPICMFYNIYKMATVSSYTFDNMSRIGLDECCKSQGDLQNVNSANYMLQNYHISDCSMKNTINLATTQPGIMYNGGFNSNFCGTNIDTNSKLLIGTIQTHPRCHIDLFQRPFATVPFLGRGSVNPIIESQIQQGDTSVNKRSVNNLSEKSYIDHHIL